MVPAKDALPDALSGAAAKAGPAAGAALRRGSISSSGSIPLPANAILALAALPAMSLAVVRRSALFACTMSLLPGYQCLFCSLSLPCVLLASEVLIVTLLVPQCRRSQYRGVYAWVCKKDRVGGRVRTRAGRPRAGSGRGCRAWSRCRPAR